MNQTQPVDPTKQSFLIAIYQSFWQEMSWRRTAGYRTIILGLAYCTALLAAVAMIGPAHLTPVIRYSLAGVLALATIFGSGYLAANYRKYMSAAARLVAIEQYLGAYNADFLGAAGPLMPAGRQAWPSTPLVREPVSFLSIMAFLIGGLATSAAILLV
jgi:hypothetical protein